MMIICIIVLVAIILMSLKTVLEALLWILGCTFVLCLIVLLIKILMKLLGR